MVTVMLLTGSGCDISGVEGAKTSERPMPRIATGAQRISCAVGARPDYFVPAQSRPVIIGCARLTTSGRRIEMSANRERIGGDNHVCVHPAYRGRGEMGFYIPTVCPEDPVARRPAVIHALDGRYGAKDWGVRGYEYVVWGTGDVSTSAITLHHRGGEAAAALFRVDQRLASALGATRPFTVFIAELPSLSACEPVGIAAEGGLLAEAEPLARQPRECTEHTRR
jgi:hypothetical protein